jgi:hypothetical protein
MIELEVLTILLSWILKINFKNEKGLRAPTITGTGRCIPPALGTGTNENKTAPVLKCGTDNRTAQGKLALAKGRTGSGFSVVHDPLPQDFKHP